MKKLLLLVSVFFFLHTVHAQLTNTKWKGVLKIDNGPVNVVFNFKKDSLIVTNTDDGSIIETMTYTKTKSSFTLSKVYGQSDCDATKGTYKYIIKQNKLTLTKLDDPCYDRSSVIDNVTFTKQ